MLRILFSILIGFVSVAATASDADSTIQRSSDFISLGPKLSSFEDKIPGKLKKAWRNVGSHANFRVMRIYKSYDDLVYVETLRQAFERLFNNKRIYILDAAAEEHLGIKKYLSDRCQNTKQKYQKTCMDDLKAFYMPFLDAIFIRDLPTKQFEYSLYHELIHAMQFTFSLPWDIYLLFENLNSKVIQEDNILDYLAFHYEAQSNWHELQYSEDPRWLQKRSFTIPLANEVKRGAGIIPSLLLKAVGSDPDGWVNFIPKIDQDVIDSLADRNPYKRALFANELFVFRRRNRVLGNQFDLKFHNTYATRLIESYYGKLPIVFQSGAKDQKIYASMFDKYYERILFYNYPSESKEWTESSNCLALFSKIQSYPSPLVGWLTISPSEIISCEAFYGMDAATFANVQTRFRDLLVKEIKTPFNLILRGGEGGSGDFDFVPSIPFLPQLRIRP